MLHEDFLHELWASWLQACDAKAYTVMLLPEFIVRLLLLTIMFD